MKHKGSALRFFNILLFGIILFLGYQVFHVKKDVWITNRMNDIIAREENKIISHQHVAIQDGMIGNTYVSASYPIGNANKSITILEKAMLNLVSQLYGNAAPKREIKRFSFLTAEENQTGLAKVTHYKLQAREMTVSQFKAKDSKKIDGVEFLVKDDGNVFKLTDFILDKTAFSDIFVRELESELSQKSQLTDESVEQIGILRQRSILDWQFILNPSAITLILPEPVADIAEVTLPYNKLFDIIDENYLKDDPLKEYLTYMENKDRQERIMHAGGAPVVIPGKVVALTFDDGPSPANTPRILDILAQYKAKATFYVIGSSISGNETILKRAISEGHEIGNHTWSHPDLKSLSISSVQEEIALGNKILQSNLGIKPKTFRPPYGSTNSTIATAAGLHQALWDVDTLDWKNRDPQAILDAVKSQLRPGATILMHDIHDTTVEALPLVMEYLVSEGYTFTTFSELYGY